jgi:uncharacterized protein DUF4258
MWSRFVRAKHGLALNLMLTKHARDRMLQRGLIVGDLLHIIRHGFVHEDGEESTRPGCYKYEMECRTPNSGGRTVSIVLIPFPTETIKVVTVMWSDEN